MQIGDLFGRGLLVVFVIFACAFFGQRLRARRRKKRGFADPGFYPTGTRLGNALHQLQSIVNPDALHFLQEQLQEEDEEEEEVPDPRKHILRQAARIRKGTHTGPLTALVPLRKKVPPSESMIGRPTCN